MGWDDALIALAPSIIGGFNSSGQANAQADEARRQAKLQRLAMDRAYGQQERRFTTGQGYQQGGEERFLGATANAPAELGQLHKDIVQQNTEAQQTALGENKLNLAQQGVRGGQAATMLGRQTGSLNKGMQQQLNDLAYQNAMTRQGQRAGYFGNKAMGGLQMAGSV